MASTRHRPILLALLIAVLAFFWTIDPHHLPGPLLCWFRRLTGWHCPGCGSTRALHALTHGDLAAAVRYNVLAPAAVVGVAWLAWSPRRVPRTVWYALLALVLAFGLARNVWPALAPPSP